MLDSSSRKQLVAIAGISSLLSVVFSGLDVVFTVYSVNRLEMDAAELALLRSLRWIVSIPFLLLMSGVSDRLGQKNTAFAAIMLTAGVSALTVLIPGKSTLFATLPVYGGLTAMLLVSMNVMSQGVKEELQNLSNTLYRSTSIGFAIAGPLCAGFLIAYGYSAAFMGFTAVLAVSLGVLSLYPEERAAFRGKERLIMTFLRTVENWKLLFRDRDMLTFIVMTGLLNQIVMVNLVLFPVKMMDELGVSSQHFTWVMTIASSAGLLFTIAAGFGMKKYLAVLIVVPFLLSSACNLLMGLQADVMLTSILYVLSSALFTVTMAPASVYLSGLVKDKFGAAFSLFKILSAAMGFVVSAVLSLLQPVLGIDLSLVACGLSGIGASLLFMSRMSKSRARRTGQTLEIG